MWTCKDATFRCFDSIIIFVTVIFSFRVLGSASSLSLLLMWQWNRTSTFVCGRPHRRTALLLLIWACQCSLCGGRLRLTRRWWIPQAGFLLLKVPFISFLLLCCCIIIILATGLFLFTVIWFCSWMDVITCANIMAFYFVEKNRCWGLFICSI